MNYFSIFENFSWIILGHLLFLVYYWYISKTINDDYVLPSLQKFSPLFVLTHLTEYFKIEPKFKTGHYKTDVRLNYDLQVIYLNSNTYRLPLTKNIILLALYFFILQNKWIRNAHVFRFINRLVFLMSLILILINLFLNNPNLGLVVLTINFVQYGILISDLIIRRNFGEGLIDLITEHQIVVEEEIDLARRILTKWEVENFGYLILK